MDNKDEYVEVKIRLRKGLYNFLKSRNVNLDSFINKVLEDYIWELFERSKEEER